MSTRPNLCRALSLCLASTLAACPDWDPVRGLVVGEGRQVSAPAPADFEHGVRPDSPARYAPIGEPRRVSLETPWVPLRLETPSRDCFAPALDFGTHDLVFGPLTSAARARRPRLVLRAPDGAIVADRAAGLVYCNEAGYDHVLLDIVAADGAAIDGVIGVGIVEVTMHVRGLDPEEQWQRDARASPFLVTGVALADPEGVRKPLGPEQTRRLEDFAPLVLTLAPATCAAVTIALAPDAAPAPGLRMFDAPFRFEVGTTEVLHAHRVVAGVLVTDEVCNPTGDPLNVEVRFEPRAGIDVGDGGVRLRPYGRPIHLAAPRSPFLARPFAPPDEGRWQVVATHPRRLERFEPVTLSVREGACMTVRVTLGRDGRVARGATHDSHLFVYRGAVGSDLAQGQDGDVMRARAYCNETRMGPIALTLELVARAGRPPGRGALLVEVLERPR